MQVIYDQAYLRHESREHHVENPERLEVITERLLSLGLEDLISPAPANIDDVLRVHDASYVEHLRSLRGRLDLDTYVADESFDIAFLAAGGSMEAVRRTETGEDALALVRPPGHHAGRNFGGGFCLMNNVAVAAASENAKGRRIAIVDIDGHHGNGTQDIFYGNPDVLYMSTHHYGIFPGTGAAARTGGEEAPGTNVNVPLPEGSGDRTFEKIMKDLFIPVLEQYRPDTIIVSIGLDCHYLDPLTGLALSSSGILSVVERISSAARRITSKGAAFVLEGGYNGDVLAEVFGAMYAGSGDLHLNAVPDRVGRGFDSVDSAVSYQSRFWDL